MSQSSTWFVKIDGKVRGPFNLGQLKSMKDRGRLSADSEVSNDRSSWVFAVSIPELFGEIISVAPVGSPLATSQNPSMQMVPSTVTAQGGPAVPAAYNMAAPAMPPGAGGGMIPDPHVGLPQAPVGVTAPEPNPECYYQVDGIRQGPVPLSGIRDLITVGTLQHNDFVWLAGSPTWVQVQDVPALAVPDQIARARGNFKNSPILISCVAAAAMLLVALPTWYILSADDHKEGVRQDAAARAVELRQEALRLEAIARDERHRSQNLSIDERRHSEEMALLGQDNRRYVEGVQLKEDEIRTQAAGFDKMANSLSDFKSTTNSKIASAERAAAEARSAANAASQQAAQASSQASRANADAQRAESEARIARQEAAEAKAKAN